MEHEHHNSELDDLLQDIRRLIDKDDGPSEQPAVPGLDELAALEALPELEDLDDLPELRDLPNLDDIPALDDLPKLDDLDLSALLADEPATEPEPPDELDLSGYFANDPQPEPEPTPEPTPEPEPEASAPPAQPVAPVIMAPSEQTFHQTRWTDRQKVPRHVAKLQQNQDQAYADWLYEQDRRGDVPPPVFPQESDMPVKKKKKKQEPVYPVNDTPKKKRHGFRNFLITLVLLTLAAVAVVVFLLPRQPMSTHSAGSRQAGVSTILLIGTDAGGARTDTLMLLSADRTDGELSLVSIPRDTLVNGEYAVPKINSVYGANNGGAEGIEMLLTRVEQSVGFRPDGYILVRLDAFTRFVDLLGGVDFDVPVDMFYNDASQDLHIALEAGYQHLSGEEAMGLVRFRSGYADADLGRVQVQREFLSALMDQAVSANGVLRSPLLLHVLMANTETDLTAGNLLWLAETALFSDLKHVETATLPGTARNFETGSYYVLDPAGVAQTVNSYCNPYDNEITVEDLQIRTN